jgi:hypothetical protein
LESPELPKLVIEIGIAGNEITKSSFSGMGWDAMAGGLPSGRSEHLVIGASGHREPPVMGKPVAVIGNLGIALGWAWDTWS